MVQRTKDQNTLVIGDWNATCDECDFKFKASDLKKDWRNLYLCRDCYQPRHPQDFLRGHPDDPSVPWTRPEKGSVACGPSNVAGQAIAGCAIAGHFLTYQNPL